LDITNSSDWDEKLQKSIDDMKENSGITRVRKSFMIYELFAEKLLKLPSNSNNIVALILCMECGFYSSNINYDICEAISNISTIKECIAILTDLSQKKNIHLIWYYAILARISQLLNNGSDRMEDGHRLLIHSLCQRKGIPFNYDLFAPQKN